MTNLILTHDAIAVPPHIIVTRREMAEALLCHPCFCDCMKGLIINFEAVEKRSDNCFVLRDGHTLPVGRLKYRAVRERFLEYFYSRTRDGGARISHS